MSIKGTTKELYVGKTGVNLITFMGNKVSITYNEMKRIDYCYATSKKGYINFVTQANIIENFNFSNNVNELIQKTVDFIHEYAPNLEMIEYQLDDEKKNRSIKIQAIFGYKELGLRTGDIIITQEPSGKIFLNKDKSTFYDLIEYEWDGPEFSTLTTSSGTTTEKSKTKSKEKSSDFGLGAVVGNIMLGGINGKNKGLSKTIGNVVSNSTELSSNIEKSTNATITFRNQDSKKNFKLSFKCTRDIDSKIRCFDFSKIPDKAIIVNDVKQNLEGIKALKELLDIGALTQEEFDEKKKQILNM